MDDSDRELIRKRVDEEVRGEITLVSVALTMCAKDLEALLQDLGVSMGEYEHLTKKYSHLIKRWQEENNVHQTGVEVPD